MLADPSNPLMLTLKRIDSPRSLRPGESSSSCSSSKPVLIYMISTPFIKMMMVLLMYRIQPCITFDRIRYLDDTMIPPDPDELPSARMEYGDPRAPVDVSWIIAGNSQDEEEERLRAQLMQQQLASSAAASHEVINNDDYHDYTYTLIHTPTTHISILSYKHVICCLHRLCKRLWQRFKGWSLCSWRCCCRTNQLFCRC
jgi:hypothetical protein